MRILEAIGSKLNVSKSNFCPLQTTRRECCLWWLRSFENAGNIDLRWSITQYEHFLEVIHKKTLTPIDLGSRVSDFHLDVL